MIKSFELVLREVCKVQDVASLITTASGYTFQTRRVYATEFGQLTSSKSLRGIVNMAIYTGNIHRMFVAGIVTKREGFSSNQHRTFHLDT